MAYIAASRWSVYLDVAYIAVLVWSIWRHWGGLYSDLDVVYSEVVHIHI